MIALFDACVLYPAPLRDLLMQLAISDLFRAKWADAIHDEWIRSLLKQRPDLKLEQLERTRALMNSHVQDCIVARYESIIDKLALPDPDDRHVLAAAIHAGASIIVTFNLADFPAEILTEHEIVAEHPDDFVVRLLAADFEAVCAAIRRQRNPPKTAEELLTILEQESLVKTVVLLRDHADSL